MVLRRGADCAKAREPGRREARSRRERAKRRKPEGLGSQRAAPVCLGPEHQAKAAERSVRGFYAVAEPAVAPEDRQSEHSDAAGTGQQRSTKCRRDGPGAAQRSSGLARRQQGSPTGADGRGCKRPEGRRGAQRSPAPTDDGNREGGPGRKARQAMHQAGRERRRGATPATATPDAYRTDL